MGTLKSYLIKEEIKESHAERYLTYVERYHSEVFLDLKHALETEWTLRIKQLERVHPISAEEKQEVTLFNPKASLDMLLITRPVKLITVRSRTPIEVSPSVKIPHVYKQEQRDLIIKSLLVGAHQVLSKITNGWKEVFSFERSGKLSPWFKITVDHDELRLQLATSASSEVSYRTLYSVRVEYGKSGSKLKDFDRLYLTSSI